MKQQGLKTGVDVIKDVLEAANAHYKASPFLQSLQQQYEASGFLTKKQLEGLAAKAQKIATLPAGKLATLQAIIQKMPNRYKSDIPAAVVPVFEKNIPIKVAIAAILNKYPQHRQVLLLKAKYDTNTPLSKTETADLERFYKHLVLKNT